MFVFGIHLLATLQWLRQFLLPGPVAAADIVLGSLRSQIIVTIAEMGIPEVLAVGPKSASEIAHELGAGLLCDLP